VSPAEARLQFDTTANGGETWTALSQLPIHTTVITDSQYPYDPDPAVSIPSLSTWWVAQRGAPVSLHITVDAATTGPPSPPGASPPDPPTLPCSRRERAGDGSALTPIIDQLRPRGVLEGYLAHHEMCR
jgi:hypothetical protein